MKLPPAIPDPTLDQFEQYARRLPGRLGVWRVAGNGVFFLLQLVEVRRAATLRAVTPDELPAWTRLHQDVAGNVTRWAFEYLPDGPTHRIPDQDVHALLRLASDWNLVEDALSGARQGIEEFRSDRRVVTFHNVSDPENDALDRWLAALEEARRPLPKLDGNERARIQAWLDRRRGDPAAFERIPDWLFTAVVRMGDATTAVPRRHLPGDTEIDGFTLDEAFEMWRVMLGWCFFTTICVASLGAVEAALPHPTPEALAADLSAHGGVDLEAAVSLLSSPTSTGTTQTPPLRRSFPTRADCSSLPLWWCPAALSATWCSHSCSIPAELDGLAISWEGWRRGSPRASSRLTGS